MAESSKTRSEPACDHAAGQDLDALGAAASLQAAAEVSVRRWFLAYGLFVLAATAVIVLLIQQDPHASDRWANSMHGWHWQGHSGVKDLGERIKAALAQTPTEVKLLVLLVFLSLCTTYWPMPTGWIVTMMAMRDGGVGDSALTAALLVGLVGGVGSTLANLNDYHFFTWVLRNRRVAKIRNTRLYAWTSRWFARSPFFILWVFTLLPLPVDVVRLLAITCRYDRLRFAAASFLGRFVRYGVFAFVTFHFDLGWVAPIALLALAAVLVLIKGGHHLLQKYVTNAPAA